MTLRTFILHVEDLPGVLDRVASLFRRRNYNIESLAVGRSHVRGVSRMMIATHADDDAARRIEAHLYKLVNVLRVEDTARPTAVTRELALVKVRADVTSHAHLTQVCDVFRARVVDVAPEALSCEITGARDMIDSLVQVLAPYGVLELVRTKAA